MIVTVFFGFKVPEYLRQEAISPLSGLRAITVATISGSAGALCLASCQIREVVKAAASRRKSEIQNGFRLIGIPLAGDAPGRTGSGLA